MDIFQQWRFLDRSHARRGHGTKRWYDIASSSDGTKLAATVSSENIWTSTDSGATWTERSPGGSAQRWHGIASSSDGKKLAAVINSGNIWTSHDSRVVWREVLPGDDTNMYSTKLWNDIASSSDGAILAAVAKNGFDVSTDSGATWDHIPGAPTNEWHRVASSSDGYKILPIIYGAYIYALDASAMCDCCEVKMKRMGVNVERECVMP